MRCGAVRFCEGTCTDTVQQSERLQAVVCLPKRHATEPFSLPEFSVGYGGDRVGHVLQAVKEGYVVYRNVCRVSPSPFHAAFSLRPPTTTPNQP